MTVEHEPSEDMIELLVVIEARDWSAPVRRCGALLRAASARGWVVQRPPVHRNGVPNQYPVILTDLGTRALRKAMPTWHM